MEGQRDVGDIFSRIGDRDIQEARGEALARVDAASERVVAEHPEAARFLSGMRRALERGTLRLPILPATAAKVISLIDAPEIDLAELAGCVACDPGLATRVMGVANSSYFRGADPVANVAEALMRMGIREARVIVVVISLRSTILRGRNVGEAARVLWRHSLLTALVAEELASETPPWERAGFLAGLLHDIGRVVLLGFLADRAEQDSRVARFSPACRDKLLRELDGVLGELVLDSWNMNGDFARAVGAHHAPETAPPPARSLAELLHAADEIAHAIADGWPTHPEDLSPELMAIVERIGIDPIRAMDVATEAEAGVESLAKFA